MCESIGCARVMRSGKSSSFSENCEHIESLKSIYNRSRTQKHASTISILCTTALRVHFWRLWQLRHFENHFSSRMAFSICLISRDARRVFPAVTRLTVYRRLPFFQYSIRCCITPANPETNKFGKSTHKNSIVLINRKFISLGCNVPRSVW